MSTRTLMPKMTQSISGLGKGGDEYAQAEAVSVLSFAVVGLHCRTLDPAEYE